MFINKKEINKILDECVDVSTSEVNEILEKALSYEELSNEEIAKLLQVEDNDTIQRMLEVAGQIKTDLYKNRVVLFAPLYISDYCTNNCTYCGYQRDNKFPRRKLTKDEIIAEVKELEKLGHKRLALEVGEDEFNCSFDYILQAIDWIYEAGDIRRINVNVAATTVENFKKLNDKEIGTYILFQETYDIDKYEEYHPKSLKGNYERQLYAHHRAMEAGIEDVGGGVLYGLSDYKFDTLAMVLHNRELEKTCGVGFHTVSVPRIQKAAGMNVEDYPNIVDDKTFEKIVAVLRIAIPYTGMILSTRETYETRNKLIRSGISQISAGSQTGVGSYNEGEEQEGQFDLQDDRTPMETIKDLLKEGFLPSYCTACYRMGRTGDHFMDIVRAGKIGEICAPNALVTFVEYVRDYGDEELKELAKPVIKSEIEAITNPKLKETIIKFIERINDGESDLYV